MEQLPISLPSFFLISEFKLPDVSYLCAHFEMIYERIYTLMWGVESNTPLFYSYLIKPLKSFSLKLVVGCVHLTNPKIDRKIECLFHFGCQVTLSSHSPVLILMIANKRCSVKTFLKMKKSLEKFSIITAYRRKSR